MKRYGIILLCAVIVSILHLQVFTSSIGKRVEPWALDFWFNLRGVETAPQDIVIVAMDESSYRVLNLPMDQAWPRALHAQLLKRLSEQGAKRVVMDILFLGPSSDSKADMDLADSLKSLPSVIGTETIVKEVASGAGRYSMEELLEPYEIFSKNVETVALVKMTEEFGYVRRFFLERSVTNKTIPILYEAAVGYRPDDKSLPGERDFLWYYGPPGAITTVSYHQALNPDGKIPKDFFKNKVVFVGLNLLTEVGPAQKDSYRTPFDDVRTMFGVEIQATAAANLIDKKKVTRASALLEGIGAFFITTLLTSLVFYLRPQWGAVLLVSTILLWIIFSYVMFRFGFFLPGLIFVLSFFPICYLASTFIYYILTYRSQQQVEKAFQFYLSPEMAKQMSNNPNALSLGGESVFATALFTDIAGFSEITENMNATDVSRMLNSYFTEVINEIFERKGTLIKFIGDAVFALWGAPIKTGDHAKLACESAVAIHRAVERFNSTKRFPALHTRIGVNTGPMLVGNLGSERRFDYTAIGDSVNLASRIEGVNKYLGTSILISDSTKKEIGGSGLNTLALGFIKVVGKKERVGINTLLEKPIDPVLETKWNDALSSFRMRRWDDCESLFKELSTKDPIFKKAVELYLVEINRNRQESPEDDWQGEIEFHGK